MDSLICVFVCLVMTAANLCVTSQPLTLSSGSMYSGQPGWIAASTSLVFPVRGCTPILLCLRLLSLSFPHLTSPAHSNTHTFRCFNVGISQTCLCVEPSNLLLNYSCPTSCNSEGRDLEVLSPCHDTDIIPILMVLNKTYQDSQLASSNCTTSACELFGPKVVRPLQTHEKLLPLP